MILQSQITMIKEQQIIEVIVSPLINQINIHWIINTLKNLEGIAIQHQIIK